MGPVHDGRGIELDIVITPAIAARIGATLSVHDAIDRDCSTRVQRFR